MAKIVFFGTPKYVIPVLEALKGAKHEIAAVVTQPPKPVGRKQELTPSPVAQWAKKRRLPLLTDATAQRYAVAKADVGVLASYGRIVPPEVVHAFPHGILNIHPSLLPKYRGASPVEAAIAAGDKQTGVTIMKLDEKLDHGPILAQFTENIKPQDTCASLRERLFRKGAEVLTATLPAYLEGRITPREQDHSKATYTALIKKEHGFIPVGKLAAAVKDGTRAAELERLVRAFYPWPGAWTNVHINRKSSIVNRLKILKTHVEGGKLILDQVQLEGKKPVSWQQFKQGYPQFHFV